MAGEILLAITFWCLGTFIVCLILLGLLSLIKADSDKYDFH